MNKQELIEKFENLLKRGYLLVNMYDVLDLVKKLDESQKVTIPQFVANWIEYCKFTHVDLQHALIVGDVYFYNYANQKDFSKLKEFLETENNQETFARAWLDGYEVEKEKRYLVKIKNLNTLFCYLAHSNHGNYWSITYSKIDGLSTKHTRKELEEAGFGWVFDCEGVRMILSDEEYLEFIKEGQKFALEKLKDYFQNDVEKEAQDDSKV